jgi:hypothetical protein
VLDLAWVGLVSGRKGRDIGIGALEIDVDHRQLAAEAELAARGIGHDLLEYRLRGAAIGNHAGSGNRHAFLSPLLARTMPPR